MYKRTYTLHSTCSSGLDTAPWPLKLWVSAAWWRVLLSKPDSEHPQVWPCKQTPVMNRETETDARQNLNAHITHGPENALCVRRSCDGGGCMSWKPRELWAIPMDLWSPPLCCYWFFLQIILTHFIGKAKWKMVSVVRSFCSRNWLEWKQTAVNTFTQVLNQNIKPRFAPF